MELTKNIFFNTDKLIENSKVKISYTGKFYQENCQNVHTCVHGLKKRLQNTHQILIEIIPGRVLYLCLHTY